MQDEMSDQSSKSTDDGLDEEVLSNAVDDIQVDDIQVPEEIATRREIVEFMADKLEGALTEGGGIYLSIPGMCKALGLASQSQVRRIKGTPTLFKGLRLISTKTSGGPQKINFLRADKIALWLAGVESAKMRRDTERQRFLREKIERYQEELAPIATQVFLRVLKEGPQLASMVPTVQPENPLLMTLAQQIHDIAGAVPSIQQGVVELLGATDAQAIKLESLLEIVSSQAIQLESLLEITSSQTLNLQQAIELLSRYLQSQEDIEEKLERVDTRTKRLSPDHAIKVQNAVGHIVRLIQKKNASISDQIAHRMVYGRLKSHFRPATSYKEIDDDRFEEVMEFLRREYRTILEEGPKQEKLF
ncbi:hypothetical protein KDA_75410 [Dictyobacter alpinus]|uniref:Antirepressor protein ant N-terminal domain-containing protein n=1 Tax=Dictyobacter alpinus TaxID=2014873 RepID=A0A402BL17_9CHLR|nr:phage antirepressor N-terminal domain-containing protein [Dictyobacter alpinus]GCE32057.1 hypothetical protein KDA_75410 [Dictyobacter alpinus]